MAKKIFQSRDVRVEPAEERGPELFGPATRTIQVQDLVDGKLSLNDRDFVSRFATAEDYRVLRGLIETRQRERPTGWRVLPGGNRISAAKRLFLCDNKKGCHATFWLDADADGLPCLTCNSQKTKDGGRLRIATELEIANWFMHEEAALARFMADAPRRRAETAAANRQRFERGRM